MPPPQKTTADSGPPKQTDAVHRFLLVKKTWPDTVVSTFDLKGSQYDAFFKYFDFETAALRHDPTNLAIRTPDGILDLISDLKQYRDKPLSHVVGEVAQRHHHADAKNITRSLEVCCRIWLTLDIRSQATTTGPVHALVHSIDWPKEQSLDEVVQSQFRKTNLTFSAYERKIDPAFTAAYLENVCGIGICWTDNLIDHLHFDKSGRRIMIYQHKICLQNHLKSIDEPIVPRQVLQEAMDTLNLLFPFGEQETKELLAKHRQPFYNLGYCEREPILDIARYSYWGVRLLDLIKAYEDAPRDLRQLLRKKRDFSSWLNIWIGVCVLTLTVVSIVFGTVSTVYAIKQYQLALAQVCADPDISVKLPQYCATKTR